MTRHDPNARGRMERLEPRRLLAAHAADHVLGHYRTDATLSQPRDNPALATVGDRALFIGGEPSDPGERFGYDNGISSFSPGGGSDVVDVYDARTGQWAVTHLPRPRGLGATAVTVGDDVFVTGGADPASTGTIDVFHARLGTWATVKVPIAGAFDAAGVVGDTVIFTASRPDDEATPWGPAVELYDVAAGRWSGHALSSGGHGALAVVGSRALFFQAKGVIDLYDAATGQWSTRRVRRAGFGAAYNWPVGDDPPWAVVGGQKVVFAGSKAPGVYNVATGRWAPAPASLPLSGEQTITAVGDKAILMPGPSPYGDASDEAIVYDAASGHWSTAHLSEPKSSPARFVVGHKAVFIGGQTPEGRGSEPSLTTDVYDEQTGKWSHGRISQTLEPDWYAPMMKPVDGQWVTRTSDEFANESVAIFVPSAVGEPSGPSVRNGGAVATAGGPRVLTWAASPGATGYDVYLDDRLAASVSTNRWQVGRPLAAGDHAWQVVALGGASSSRTPGPRWRFAVGAPAAPNSPNVPNGAALAAPPDALSWAAVPGATDYLLYLDGQRVLQTSLTAAQFDEPIAGGAHAWGVVACNAAGEAVSPAWTFTTPAPPFTQTSVPLPTPPGGYDPVVANGKVVVAGLVATPGIYSNYDVNVYDPATGAVTTSSPTPDELLPFGVGVVPTGGDEGHPVVVGDRVIYADNAAADAYDVSSGQWSSHPLSVPRYGWRAGAVGHYAVFAGGWAGENGEGGVSDAVDVYDADTGDWTTAHLSVARGGMSVAVVGGKLVFAGGEADGGPSDAADVFDPATVQWTAARLSVPHDGAAVTVAGDRAYFAGGDVALGDNGAASRLTDAVEVYDAGTGQWSVLHLSSARTAIAAVTVGRFALFAGGDNAAAPDAAAIGRVVDVYDTVSGTWSTARLSSELARFSPAEVVIATLGGRAFLAHDGVVEIFDASSAQWSSVPLRTVAEMPSSDPTAPPDVGQVLVVGQAALFGGGPSLDVYEPGANRWSILRLNGDLGDVFSGVVVDGQAFYVTRSPVGDEPPEGRPQLDVLTFLPGQGDQP